jgi:hypothetical protein
MDKHSCFSYSICFIYTTCDIGYIVPVCLYMRDDSKALNKFRSLFPSQYVLHRARNYVECMALLLLIIS